jgi:hypothetical protein
VFQLILTVMSISLAAGAALITMSYLDPTIPIQKQAQQRIEAGFDSLHESWLRHKDDNEVYSWVCDHPLQSDGSCDDFKKVVSDAGLPTTSAWKAQLFPEYGFEPQPPEGFTYSYNDVVNGLYFCAAGNANSAQLKGFYRAQQHFPVDSYIISSTCGDLSGDAIESVNASGLKITYWVKRQ